MGDGDGGEWVAEEGGGLEGRPSRHGGASQKSTCRVVASRALSLVGLVAVVVFVGSFFTGGRQTFLRSLRMVRGEDKSRSGQERQRAPSLIRRYTPKLVIAPSRSPEPMSKDRAPSSVYSNACDDVELILSKNAGADISEIVMVGGRLVMPGVPIEHIKADTEVYVNFQACLPVEKIHRHYHDIYIRVHAIKGDPDLFISVSKPNPRIDDSTWLSKDTGDDEITIATNPPDFVRGTKTLYFSVMSQKVPCEFFVELEIRDRKQRHKNLRVRRDDEMYGWIHRDEWKSAEG